MSHVRFGIGQTWDRTPHSNAADLANHASEIVNLMTCIRPTVCLSVRKSIRQSVCSCADCLSANQITDFYAYLYRYTIIYCIVLYCIVLYCIVLYCIVLYCIVLYCIVLYCIVLYCIGDNDNIYALRIWSSDSIAYVCARVLNFLLLLSC